MLGPICKEAVYRSNSLRYSEALHCYGAVGTTGYIIITMWNMRLDGNIMGSLINIILQKHIWKIDMCIRIISFKENFK